MKKILTLLLIFLVSCSGGKTIRFPIKENDIRKTYTEEYIITERCIGCNNLGIPYWETISVDKTE